MQREVKYKKKYPSRNNFVIKDESEQLSKNLMSAVGSFDVEKVKKCLLEGADPNFNRGDCNCEGNYQPYDPLRMVVFRMTDCNLSKENLMEFKEIARILLENGSDPFNALIFAKMRFGFTYKKVFQKDDPEDKDNIQLSIIKMIIDKIREIAI